MYFVGVDIGTSSTKAVIFDSSGRTMGSGSVDYEVERGPQGEVEQDPNVWWLAAAQAVSNAFVGAGVSGRDVAAVGLSGQMHGLVPLGEGGVIVHKAILHSDVRSKAEVEELDAIFSDAFIKITRNPVFSGFQAVSLYWLRKHQPEVFGQIRHVLCPKDYVRFRLTGALGTEHTDASATLLYDMESGSWSPDIASGIGLDPDVLPERIARPYDIAGTVTRAAAHATGLAVGTPVVYGGADQAMHSIGNGVFTDDATMVTVGSSGQVLAISASLPSWAGQPIHTFRHVNDGYTYGLAGVLSAGNALSWFRASFAEGVPYGTLDSWARAVPAGSGGLVFLPCIAGERTPYMDPNARGVFLGASALHDRRHFARAVMEGVSFAMKTGFDVLTAVHGVRDRLVCAGGAMRAAAWSRIQADVLGRELSVSRVAEQGCLGAAVMAAIGVGAFEDLESACRSMCDQDMRTVVPREENFQLYSAIHQQVYSKMYENNANAFEVLAQLTSHINSFEKAEVRSHV